MVAKKKNEEKVEDEVIPTILKGEELAEEIEEAREKELKRKNSS